MRSTIEGWIHSQPIWRPLFCSSSQLCKGLKYSDIARVEISSPVASFKTFRQSSVLPFFQNVIQPRPDFLVAGIVTGLRRLMQDLAGDVVVQLKLKHGSESVVIIVSGVIVDVRLGCGVAPFFATR